MKSLFSLLIFFILQSASFAQSQIPLDRKTTEQGYSPNDFCKVNAQRRIAELDNQSLEEIEKVKKAQRELNQLNARKNIIKGFLDLRDKFVKSLENIVQEKADVEKTNLEDFRNLMRSTLAIQTVSALYNSTPEAAANKNVNVTTLCEDPQNKGTAFCSYLKEAWFTGSIKEPLDETLANLTTAQDQLSPEDKNKMKTNFQTVMSTLPARLSPQAVFSTLSERAPNLAAHLGDEYKQDLEKCIGEEDDRACKKLLKNENTRSGISKLLKAEIDNVKQSFASERQQFVDEKIQKIYKDHDDIKENKEKRLNALFKDKLNSALKIFEDQKSREKLAEIGIDDSTYASFKSACMDQQEQSREKCRKISADIIGFFDSKLKELDEQIVPKQAELNALSSTGGSLGKILKMRQYVAQKFLRKCSNANQSEILAPLATLCNRLNRGPASDEDAVDSLGGKLNDVVSRLLSDNRLSANRGELGLFSKDELKVYMNYCTETTAEKSFSDICDDVYTEYSQIKNMKESKDWEEFSKKYWVLPSDKNPKGYEVYEKKSNLRIFGEGLSQSVNRIYPIWFTNMSMGYQIETLESQALFMKQMNYMYSPTSPWANYTYFGGSYYTFPTSTNFSNPFSTTAGFNFSN